MRRQSSGASAFHRTRPSASKQSRQIGEPRADRRAGAGPSSRPGGRGAALVPVAGPTGAPLAAPLPAGVDRAEAGGGEGDEQPRMAGDAVGDALAAVQTGPDQLVGVGPVGGGAGGAARLAPVAAGGQQHRVGLVGGVVDLADLAGGLVDVHGPAGQADRVGAVAGGGDLLLPAAELRPGGAGHQVLGDQPDRRRHPRHLLRLLAEAAMPHRAPAAPALVDGRAAAVAADLTAGHPAGGRPEQAAAAAPWRHVHDLPGDGEGRDRPSGARPSLKALELSAASR